MKQFLIILCFFLVSFWGCKLPKNAEYVQLAGHAQGTTYHITYQNITNTDYSKSIDSLLADFDKSLSVYDSTSIISRINANDTTVEINHHVLVAYAKALEMSILSKGAFDITVGKLVRAWGFGPEPKAKHDDAYIQNILQYTGINKVKLVGNKLKKASPEVILDFNALAQGYSVDLVAQFFDKQGITNYMVEIGGEIRAKGVSSHNRDWRIGIDKPDDINQEEGVNIQEVIQFSNLSVSTSGNYRKFYEENGVKYAHTINPKTGKPARNTLLSATVVAPDCITADALATTFMVLGVDKSKQLLAQLPNIEVYFVYSGSNGEYLIYASEGLKKMIVNSDK
jgi:thiamine biosynthesis lipoprotein